MNETDLKGPDRFSPILGHPISKFKIYILCSIQAEAIEGPALLDQLSIFGLNTPRF